MAYDGKRRCVLLFGGVDHQGTFGDTWSWDGTYWTQLAETGPSARSGHAMAYDASHEQVVLFGGHSGAATLNDTWVWDGVAWTQLAETGPSVRHYHAVADDEARSLIVLFGGIDAADLGDTWEWDGAAWTQREDSGPVARRGHSMSYDSASARVLLFGGAAGSQVLDDTWAWNGSLWTQLSAFGAQAGLDAAMTSGGPGALLFGGVGSTTAGTAGRDNTWEWDGHFWKLLQHFGPPERMGHAIAFDAGRNRVVIFGGARVSGAPTAATLLGDTWECPARPPVLVSVTVTPIEVRRGSTISIAVVLSGPTMDALPVQLRSSSGGQVTNLALPSSIIVPAGAAAGSVTVVVPLQTVLGPYTITASTADIHKSASLTVAQAAALGTLRIVAAIPYPHGNESTEEEVRLLNDGTTPVVLAGWRITVHNPSGPDDPGWLLDNVDGQVAPGQIARVTRQGRPMPLPNDEAVIILLNPMGETIDEKAYGHAFIGQLIQFD